MPYASPESNRLLVIVNPNSTHADRIQEDVLTPLEESDAWQHSFDVWETQPPAEFDNVSELASRVKPGDIVVACGGDGLVNIVTNALVTADDHEVIALPMAFGNGNDASDSLYGRSIHKRGALFRQLEQGVPRDMGTIKVTANEEHIRHALGYVGLGFTANASAAINTPEHRAKKKASRIPFGAEARDGLVIAKTLLGNRPFAFEAEDGAVHQSNELLFSAIPHMAKVMRIHVDTFSDEMVRTEYGPDRFVARVVRRLLTEMPFGGLRGEPSEGERLVVLSPTRIQYDGEAEDVAAGTALDIERTTNAIKVLAAD